jgi:putative transposase
MLKRKHSEAEMIGALKQLEAGRTAADVARELGVSKHTIYAWKAKYGGLDVSQAQQLRQQPGKCISNFLHERAARQAFS